MSSPLLNKLVYMATGTCVGVLLPAGAGWLTYQHTSNAALSGVVALVAIYVLMSLSVGAVALFQYVPDSLPLGPSFMAGAGILTMSMTLLPLLIVPGLVWLYLSPFDEQGYLDWTACFQLDPESFETPHHG